MEWWYTFVACHDGALGPTLAGNACPQGGSKMSRDMYVRMYIHTYITYSGGTIRIGQPTFYTKNAHVHTTITPPRKVVNNLDTESGGKPTRNFFLLRISL
jgi:hypothetical protein